MKIYMNKKEIKGYKVISSSEEAKKTFNKDLSKIDIIGSFKNESGELYVIYNHKWGKWVFDILKDGYSMDPYITGDELDWETGYQVDHNGRCYQSFALDKEEKKDVMEIVKDSPWEIFANKVLLAKEKLLKSKKVV